MTRDLRREEVRLGGDGDASKCEVCGGGDVDLGLAADSTALSGSAVDLVIGWAVGATVGTALTFTIGLAAIFRRSTSRGSSIMSSRVSGGGGCAIEQWCKCRTTVPHLLRARPRAAFGCRWPLPCEFASRPR